MLPKRKPPLNKCRPFRRQFDYFERPMLPACIYHTLADISLGNNDHSTIVTDQLKRQNVPD